MEVRIAVSQLPLKPERIVSFITNEGSYMDVDISPNDSILLFTLLGDLYTLPVTGGKAKQITRGLGINRFPAWSPSGNLIAYESDATGYIGLHVINTRGTFHKVLDQYSRPASFKPIWFPDGELVSSGKVVYNLNGEKTVLPKEVNLPLLNFSSDDKLMYGIDRTSAGQTVIYKFDRVSQNKADILVLNKNYTLNNPQISRDAHWLTYIKGDIRDYVDSLMVIDLKTGYEKLLAPLSVKFPGNAYWQRCCFSKDCKYFFIGYGGKIKRIEIASGNIQNIPFTANVKVNMGRFNYNTFPVSLDSFQVKYIRSVQKSPSGRQLMFSALNKIYVMNLPDGKPRVLLEQSYNQFQPEYSPDGNWVAYVTWSDTDGGQVWCVPSRGGAPQQLTSISGSYYSPSWSPDGKMIVVAKGHNKLGRRDDPGDGQIQVINLQSKTCTVIADTVPLFNQPRFSENGDLVIFKPNQQQSEDKLWPRLISLDPKIKNTKVLAYAIKDNESSAPIREITISPNRRYLVFQYNGDLYLKLLANVGDSQVIFDKNRPIPLIRFAKGSIDPHWENGGSILSWISVNRYSCIDPDKIIAAAEQLQPNKTLDGLPQVKIIDVSIPADQTVTINLKGLRYYASGITALTNVRVITMGKNDIIEHGTIIVKNGRFVSVGDREKVNIPPGANILDLTGKTIIPGLIDMHSHMYKAVPPDVFLQQSWQRLLEFSYGVTTMRDPSGSFDTFGYSELVETGQIVGPRLFTVGQAVRPFLSLTNLNEAKTVVSNRKKMGATYIKQYQQPTRLQRQLLLQACKEAGVNMTNEVEDDPLYAVGMMKDGSTGLEHNPIWGDVYSDIISLVAKSGTFLCPTLQVCYGREEGKHYFRKIYGQEFVNRSARFMSEDYKNELLEDIKNDKIDSGFLDQSRIDARIKHAGGKIIMGSHGEDQGIGVHWEIWALQMGGLSNMEALQTATITSAEALGMQKDLGSIDVGKIADLIILNRDPLEDIHNTSSIKYVMKAGVLYDSETLNEIWPKKKKGPTVWR